MRTSQRALRQVERRDVAELADRARQRETRVVVLELDVAAVDLHADERERQLTWRKRASVARPGVLIQPPTVEATVLHRQLFEVRKRRPSRRNPARERVRLPNMPI